MCEIFSAGRRKEIVWKAKRDSRWPYSRYVRIEIRQNFRCCGVVVSIDSFLSLFYPRTAQHGNFPAPCVENPVIGLRDALICTASAAVNRLRCVVTKNQRKVARAFLRIHGMSDRALRSNKIPEMTLLAKCPFFILYLYFFI
jgi:hypothetical protein